MKSMASFLVLGVLAYFTFFVDLAGKPLSTHLGEVWSSEVVQEKVGLVHHGLTTELENRLAEVAQREARRAVRDGLGGRAEEINPEDRAALEKVLAAE